MKACHQCSVGSKIPSSVSHTTFEHQQKGSWRQLGCGPHNLLATIKRNLEKTWVRPLAFAWPCLTSTKLRLLNGLEAKLQLRHAITCQSSDVWHSSRDMYTTTIQQLYNNYTTTHTTTIQQLHIYSVSLAWKLQQQKETDYHYFWCVLPKNHKIRVVV